MVDYFLSGEAMTINTQKRPKIFYGWIVVISGMLTLAMGVGVVGNCASLFIKPICDDLGFSRQAMAAVLAALPRESLRAEAVARTDAA